MQPLDVSFFAPLKATWREILTDWKKCSRGIAFLQKEQFPKLLKRLYDKLEFKDTAKANLIAGFEKCGLYPCNPECPKSRLPFYSTASSPEDAETDVGNVVVGMLKNQRYNSTPTGTCGRRKMVNVEPGRAVTSGDLVAAAELVDTTESRVQKKRGCPKKLIPTSTDAICPVRRKRQRREMTEHNSEEEDADDHDPVCSMLYAGISIIFLLRYKNIILLVCFFRYRT